MNRDELKKRVIEQIEMTWPQFQAEHPELARVIDQTMLGDFVVESLENDAAFKKAYENAVEAKIGAAAFSGLLGRFVEFVVGNLR